ncbi:phage terminase small subunit P27 family [Methylobacillus flagellatus]|uniref:phage terminase small subunit P27 family n=1 Tax=Methylobacillus flagellatus TaxID=405 RepID=UPI001484E130|nr:phage terminase small subunit P27 family [Methylobacillus flagellatus]
MAKPGPKPKPSNVHYLNGNPSKKNLGALMDSLQPEIEIPGCPPHLLPEAKKEFRRITPELQRYGLISKLDRAALSLYLQSWAELVWAEKMLKRKMDAAAKAMQQAEAEGKEYTGGDGMVEMTTNGNVIYSPYWIIANKSRHNVDKFLQNFGMSPSARSRVTPSNHLQGSLFEPEAGEESPTGFGAI